MNSPPSNTKYTYLALGDSMSIDYYTGRQGGGAVAQFYKKLGVEWKLKDFAVDGCTIPDGPRGEQGTVITLTIGGNDAIIRMDEIIHHGLDSLIKDHLRLLEDLRKSNLSSCIIIGNVYEPQSGLPDEYRHFLALLNRGIAGNVDKISGYLADIHGTFLGHEAEFLCQDIEPTLAGATAIASLFESRYRDWVAKRRG